MKLLSLFFFSWTDIVFNIILKKHSCVSGRNFILHSQQLLHTIMMASSAEWNIMKEEIRENYQFFKFMVIGKKNLDDVFWQKYRMTFQLHTEKEGDLSRTKSTCLVKASLVTLFTVQLAYYFIRKYLATITNKNQDWFLF